MSSSRGSVCLLVLLGVALAFGSPIRFDDLDEIHKFIANKLGLENSGISASSTFKSVSSSINTAFLEKEDFKLMNVTLSVYQQIFTNILNNNDVRHQPQLAEHLLKLQRKTEEMRSHLSRIYLRKQKVLHDLQRIEVDDPLVQKQAVAAYKEVYELAESMGKHWGVSRQSPAE